MIQYTYDLCTLKKGGQIMSNEKNKIQRININLSADLVKDLEKLMHLSGRYRTRTHIIEDILQQHVDTIKAYNPELK